MASEQEGRQFDCFNLFELKMNTNHIFEENSSLKSLNQGRITLITYKNCKVVKQSMTYYDPEMFYRSNRWHETLNDWWLAEGYNMAGKQDAVQQH